MDSTTNQPNEEEVDIDLDDAMEEPEDDGNPATEKSKGKRKETAGPGSKRKKTRSECWEHYTRDKNNYDRCNCNYCGKGFACASSNGTTNLNTHLTKCKAYLTQLDTTSEAQHVLNQEGTTGSVKLGRVSEAVFREATNELIVLAELSFAFIESLAWKYFCYKTKLYPPHCRKTATTDIVKMYVEKKMAMRKTLEQNKQRLSLTTDIWVAPTTSASYMVITAHFIDSSWKLQKIILGFKNVSDHKGETICDVLTECLADWGIKKVFTITVDNATANTNAMKLFKEKFSLVTEDSLVLGGEHLHLRCATHILNLVVRDGLHEVDKSVCAVRNSVHYVRSSGNRQKSFELRVDTGKISRGSLPLDCKTRWNSTYLMLNRAVKFRIAFEKMEAEDKLYNDYFAEIIGGKKKIGPPSKADWDDIERLEKFLQIFYNSTMRLSASTSVRSYKCYNEIVNIQMSLHPLSESSDLELKNKAIAMIAKFEKYWNPFGEMNKLLIVATVFDPKNKMKFAEVVFDTLYGKDSVESVHLKESINDILKNLFEAYSCYLSPPGTTAATSSSSQSQATSSQSQFLDQNSGDVLDSSVPHSFIENIYKEHVGQVGVQDSISELELYLKEPVVNPNLIRGSEFDVLSWWKVNACKYPIMAAIAKDILAMQVSSVASKSAFSTSGRILDPYRSCLTHYTIEVLMCFKQWLKSEIHINERGVITIQQMLADIEMQDELQREYEYETEAV